MRKILIASIVGILLLGACGGGGKKNLTSGSGKNDEYAKLVAKRKSAKIKVTYESRDSSGTASAPYTISQDGTGNVARIEKNSKTVVNSNGAFQCDNLDTEPDCQQMPAGTMTADLLLAGSGSFLGLDAYFTAGTDLSGISKSSSESIAGRDALCVTITPGAALGKLGGAAAKALGGKLDFGWQVCNDKATGFMLRQRVTGNDTDKSELVAVKVEEPSAADFETPTTTVTTEGSTDTTSGDETTDTTGDDSGTATTVCTPYTMPSGVTLPPGVTLPDVCI